MTTSIDKHLQEIANESRLTGLREMFSTDPNRAKQFSFKLDDIFLDLSKTHITKAMLDCYVSLSEEIGLIERRDAMFSGERINLSEDRAVLHSILRGAGGQQYHRLNKELLANAKSARNSFVKMVQTLSARLNSDTESITDLIHVGIGGSALGPQLLFEALKPLNSKLNIHFIGNVDGHQMASVLSQCEPQNTLVFGVSKTFKTDETLVNLATLKTWYSSVPSISFQDHFYAISANQLEPIAFGVKSDNLLTFPEWVGGRFSVWSGVSLSVAAALGLDVFEEFLAGAEGIDINFSTMTLQQNPAFILAALDHFYTHYFAATSRATFAYDFRLRSLVPYLQQLEMESNGKDRDLKGGLLDYPSSPVIWGGVGTDMQHSTFQFLHQGTHFVPTEFIVVKNEDHDLPRHHQKLLANAFAQPAALMQGRNEMQLSKEVGGSVKLTAKERSRLFTGNRPSSTYLLERLTPRSLGACIALYEHRTFCFGVLNNINSFDQMGVELGKQLAGEIEPIMRGAKAIDACPLDGSTQQLLSIYKSSQTSEC